MSNIEEQKGMRPTHGAYIVRNSKDGSRSFWDRIGSAWLHRDGHGFSLDLDAYPAKGQRIELRMIDWKKSDAGEPLEERDAAT